MAPINPTINQRMEELEEVVGNLESKVTEMVSQEVEKGVAAMKHSLVELLLQGQETRRSCTKTGRGHGSDGDHIGGKDFTSSRTAGSYDLFDAN